jgi:hypothetical protein
VLHMLMLAAALAHGGTVHGVVRAEGSLEPLPHAYVTIAELGRSAPADAKGYFVLPDVPSGRWRAEASAIGYASHALTIVVAGGSVRIEFELPVRPVPMPVIEVRTRALDSETATAPLPQPGPPAIRVQRQALRTVPGLAEPDVLRALQTLPSVAAMSDFSSALYVRGGAADQSIITLDGMPLFNPYHVGGIFSAIPLDAVAAVDVWAGAMPARAGDRVSGSVHVHSREGGRDRTRTSGAIGLLSSHATLDGPLAQGTFLLSGRRTYLDAVSNAAYALRLIDITIPYGFWDVYGKATLPLGELGSISVSGYLNREGLNTPERMQQELDGARAAFDWGSSMVALNYRQALTPALLLQARAGYTEFRGTFDAWEAGRELHICHLDECRIYPPGPPRHVLDGTTAARDALGAVDLTWFRAAHTVRIGAQLDFFDFTHGLRALEDVDEDLFPLFDAHSAPRTLALHAEDEWVVTQRLAARVGARMLLAGDLGSAFLPRIGANLQLTPALSISAGGGAYAQPVRSLRNDESVASSFIAYDLIAAQPADVGLARGIDAVLGFSLSGTNTAVRADGYIKRMSELVLPHISRDPLRAPALVADDYRIGTGSVRGFELSAQHRRGGAELGLSYALVFAERAAQGERYRPRFERRHMIDASAVYNWAEQGVLSARLAAGTGQPMTPAIGIMDVQRYDPVTGQWQHGARQLVFGEHNSERLPGYLRLDVAARRSYQRRLFGRPMTITPYAQILNLLNTRNALVAEPVSYGQPQMRYLPQLPFLPTFGMEWNH